MRETYRRLQGLIGEDTVGRANFIEGEVKKFGHTPDIYEPDSPRGKDRHLVVRLNQGEGSELWITANYDTFGRLPAANNNASGVVSLLGLMEYIHDNRLPINARFVYFDAGLDPDLVQKKKRNPKYVPGSQVFVKHMLEKELDFIETYRGALTVQGVGKGTLCVFERTGRKGNNSRRMNDEILQLGKAVGVRMDLVPHSPNADNESFTREGLEATVIARYHEGSWHRMQTKGDDMNNINIQDVEGTIDFLYKYIETQQK